MTFINSHKAPDLTKIDISFQDPYDLNTIIPVPSLLETDRVQLIPFIPALHAESFFTQFEKDPSIEAYLPDSWPTMESFLKFMELTIRQDNTAVILAIIDKTKPSEDPRVPSGRLAGMIGWLHIAPQALSLEFAPVVILPEFQQTFVSANAIGLSLKHVLDLPSQGGLGYRRVAWTANPKNERSVMAAQKMGFVKEGLMRWTWVLPSGKEGKHVDSKERGELNGRDSVLLSVCWDDWEGGVRDMVLKRMERM